jgi:hypothetical protein
MPKVAVPHNTQVSGKTDAETAARKEDRMRGTAPNPPQMGNDLLFIYILYDWMRVFFQNSRKKIDIS